jgi:mevalonate kinase
MITVSVPGKVILMGDHAVVYGKPALLAAVNRRLTVRIRRGKNTAAGYVSEICKIVEKHFGVRSEFTVTIESDIPRGYHLGSSAAVAVGVVAATSYYLKKIWNPQLFNQLAYEAEKIRHGNPSGADNTAVTMGGFIWYRKELEFLKSIWQLPIPSPPQNFYLIDTGKPEESTGEMVAFVKSQKNLQMFLDENEIQTKRIAIAIKEGDEKLLIDAMKKGERTLEHIGVVSNKAISIIRSVEKNGGAAKILGGGGCADGVGYLLCYSHHPPGGSLPVVLGEEGVRLERNI